MKKIFSLIFCMMLLLSFTACDTRESETISSSDDVVGEVIEPTQQNPAEDKIPTQDNDPPEADVNRALCAEDVFCNDGDSSFARLSVASVLKDDYYVESYIIENGSIRTYLILECVVEEDYYSVLKSGTKVYYPIELSCIFINYEYIQDPETGKIEDVIEDRTSKTYYEREEVLNWLKEYDSFLVYFGTEQKYFKKRQGENIEEDTFENVCVSFYSSIGVIPVKEGRVSLAHRSDEKLGYRDIVGFDRYLSDQMPLEDAAKNIRKLAEITKK